MATKKPIRLTEDQRRLVEENTGIVIYALRREYGHEYACDDDNISEGMYALCRAAAGYDAACGTKFNTYAYKTIINWMRYLAKMADSPRRKPERPALSLDAPLAADSEKALGECIRDSRCGPEETAMDAQEKKIIAKLLRKIAEDEPLVVEVTSSEMVKSDILKRMAERDGVSRQAVHRNYQRRRDKIRRKYAKEYWRVMYGYENDRARD